MLARVSEGCYGLLLGIPPELVVFPVPPFPRFEPPKVGVLLELTSQLQLFDSVKSGDHLFSVIVFQVLGTRPISLGFRRTRIPRAALLDLDMTASRGGINKPAF